MDKTGVNYSFTDAELLMSPDFIPTKSLSSICPFKFKIEKALRLSPFKGFDKSTIFSLISKNSFPNIPLFVLPVSKFLRAVLFLDILRPLPQPWKFINWFILKASILFPYVWIPYFRHKKWEKAFYSENK